MILRVEITATAPADPKDLEGMTEEQKAERLAYIGEIAKYTVLENMEKGAIVEVNVTLEEGRHVNAE